MNKSLQGHRICIVGATGMIGSAVARAVAREGAALWLVARQPQRLEDLARSLSGAAAQVTIAPVDATDRAALVSYFARQVERFGPCDGVFNAVGLDPAHAGTLCQPSTDVEYGNFVEYVQRVVWSQFVTASAAAGHMIKAGSGSVVLLTATPAKGVAPWMAGHSAGHAALEGLVRALATEWSPAGIRVNGVRSGGMPETPRIQQVLSAMAAIAGAPSDMMMQGARDKPALRRMPTLAQTADVVTFLLSPRADSLTGAILNASCGEVLD